MAHMKTGLCAIWLLAAVAGGGYLANYGNEPGSVGHTPQLWPVNSEIDRPSDRPILLMFTHPQCACSEASVTELNRLLARCHNEVAVKVLFIQPTGMSQDWTHTKLWKNASRIPAVSVAVDAEGVEARRFGAESSGYVVFYDQQGKLRFNGGITASRSHEGDNAGANLIVSLVNEGTAQLGTTPVFGCGLFEESTASGN